jgi:hypothetical protein
MNGCTLVQGGALLLGIAAVIAWIAAVAAYVALWRGSKGPRGRLVFSSLWLLQSGSLGPDVEPLRRQLAQRFGLFILAVLLGVGTAVLASAVC